MHMWFQRQHTLRIVKRGFLNPLVEQFSNQTDEGSVPGLLESINGGTTCIRARSFEIHPSGHHSAQTSAPLTRRAGTLQEELMSTRIIHFTEKGLLWQCLSTRKCECMVIDYKIFWSLFYEKVLLCLLTKFVCAPYYTEPPHGLGFHWILSAESVSSPSSFPMTTGLSNPALKSSKPGVLQLVEIPLEQLHLVLLSYRGCLWPV